MHPPLLQLPTHVALWRLAWPLIAIGLLKTSIYLVDAYWVGKLGDVELTAMGGAAFAWWILLILSEIAGTGVQTETAQRVGAQDLKAIPGILTQGIHLSWILSVIVLAVCWPLRSVYFDFLGFVPGSTETLSGLAFLEVSLLGVLAFMLLATITALFRGLGDTRTALGITIFALLINAVLDPILILGWGVPSLGIAGAAWATVLANLMGTLLGFAIWLRRDGGLSPDKPNVASMRRLALIGGPVAARGVAFSLIYVALGPMINAFGTHQMAALGVGVRIEGFAYHLGVGLSVAVTTLVGQHIGAGQPDHALFVARKAARIGAVIMLPVALVMFGFAPEFMATFANETATIEAGSAYLRIQIWVLSFMALESVFEGAFAGTGRTMPTLWIGSVGTAARLPLGWFLAFYLGWGVTGLWWAIALSTFAKGTLLWVWFERLTWYPGGDERPASD